MSLSTAQLESLVDYYLPVLITAGDFARSIQQGVSGPGEKAGPNAWAEAVTDADIAVQTFFEVATRARSPALGFAGEESSQSANARYFDPEADTVVYLDPVNGTFLYKNQQDNWDIILGISHAGRLLAAISYMPAHGRFYLALAGRGALSGSRDKPSLGAMQALKTQPGSRVCLTYQAPEVVRAISERYRAFDLVGDYEAGKTVDNLNALFTGDLDAFACTAGDLLDWGAIAFIVSQAGGRVSRLDGRPLDGLDNFSVDGQSDMLVAASPAIHREILALLN